MRSILRILLAVAGLCAAGEAFAYFCSGPIDWVTVSPSGVVAVGSSTSGLAGFYVCQLGTTMYGVGPDTCKAMTSTLMFAKATGATVSWAFNDSLTCNRSGFNGGNWYWLGEAPSAWYYGPQVQ